MGTRRHREGIVNAVTGQMVSAATSSRSGNFTVHFQNVDFGRCQTRPHRVFHTDPQPETPNHAQRLSSGAQERTRGSTCDATEEWWPPCGRRGFAEGSDEDVDSKSGDVEGWAGRGMGERLRRAVGAEDGAAME